MKAFEADKQRYAAMIERYLSLCFTRDAPQKVLFEAMRYSLLAGGKRVQFLLLVGKYLGVQRLGARLRAVDLRDGQRMQEVEIAAAEHVNGLFRVDRAVLHLGQRCGRGGFGRGRLGCHGRLRGRLCLRRQRGRRRGVARLLAAGIVLAAGGKRRDKSGGGQHSQQFFVHVIPPKANGFSPCISSMLRVGFIITRMKTDCQRHSKKKA